MRLRSIASLGVGMLLVLTACTSQSGKPLAADSSPSPTSTAANNSPSPNAQNADGFRPDTRIMPIRIEGKMTEVELKLFNQPSLPFTTYVPSKDFTSEVGASDEGTGIRFYYSPKGVKDEKSYVHVFVPSDATSIEGIQDLILGDQGLLVSNGWELVDRTNIVSYAWVKEKLIYQQRTPKQTFVGAIYVGEHKGKAFYAFTYYPQQRSDSFDPEATIILENLQFKDEKS